jgi:hypothetical protein
LIALVRAVPSLGVGFLTELDRNYLHAVYTPFSFILFYEVLMLVFALPKSHTSSIAMQYEILSLIVIRRVFKDIGEFRDPAAWFEQTDAAWTVLLDMLGALAMFALIVIFRRVRRTVRHSPESSNLGAIRCDQEVRCARSLWDTTDAGSLQCSSMAHGGVVAVERRRSWRKEP